MKALLFLGDALASLRALPVEARRDIGYALEFAQKGDKHPSAKPLQGFGGAGVLEVVEDHREGTFRAVYTVRFTEVVYVLHVFKKKSTRGIKTPARHLELVRERLKEAELDYRARKLKE